MFKSPVKGVQPKRAPINFVRTVASPAQPGRTMQVQTAKSITTVESDFTIDQFSRPSAALLSLEITLDRPVRTMRLAFPYSSDTTVIDLLAFLKS